MTQPPTTDDSNTWLQGSAAAALELAVAVNPGAGESIGRPNHREDAKFVAQLTG